MKRQSSDPVLPNDGNGATAPESTDAPLPPASTLSEGAGTVGEAMEPARKRGRRLRTLAHVKGGLAAVIRALEAGTLEPKTGNALVYAYSTLANTMAGDVTAEIQQMREQLLGLGDQPSRGRDDA